MELRIFSRRVTLANEMLKTVLDRGLAVLNRVDSLCNELYTIDSADIQQLRDEKKNDDDDETSVADENKEIGVGIGMGRA